MWSSAERVPYVTVFHILDSFKQNTGQAEEENHFPGSDGHIFPNEDQDVLGLPHCKGSPPTLLQLAVCQDPHMFF